MVTKQELLVTINELETKLDSCNVVYDVANVSIKSLKVELQEYLSYLVTTDNDNVVTNLTKHITTNSTVDTNNDIRKHDTVTGFNSDDQIMQQLGTYTTGKEITVDNVVLPKIETEIEKIEISTISALTSNYTNEDSADLVVSGSGQDSLFWLRKVYIEITNQVLSEQQETRLKQSQIAGNNSVNEILARSEQFKSYLTFRCEQLSQDDQDYFTRINWIIEIDPTWGDMIVYPDWSKVSKIKMPTIIRLLRYGIPENLLINNDFLIRKYFGKDELLRCPMLIAIDLLTNHLGINHDNSVLASALRLDIGNLDRTVSIRKTSKLAIDRPLHTGFNIPCDQRNSVSNSVSVRSIGKVKTRTNIGKVKGNRPSNQRDSWMLLSVNRNTVESEIIAINSQTYRDCFLVFKRYELELNPVTKKHDHPLWLLSTQSRYGIKDNEIVGYVAIKYPNGEIERIGIVHTKYVKKQDKTVLWFSLLEKMHHKQFNQVVPTGNDRLVQYVKYVKDGATIKKQLTTRLIPETTLATITETNKIDIDPQITIFLSLYGLCHNVAIKPAKLNTINNQTKHININWSTLTGLKVAPIDKQGNIQWLPKLSCPFTVLA